MLNLFFDPCVSIGNNIWAFCDEGFLVFFDKQLCKIQFADFQNDIYKKMRIPTSNLYYSMNNIYWINNASASICYYSLEDKIYNEICITEKLINRKGYSLAQIKDGVMFVWGFLEDGVLILDTKTNVIVDKISISKNCIVKSVISVKELIYVFANDNLIICCTDSHKIYTEKIKGFGNVKRTCNYKDDIIVLFENGEVVLFRTENKTMESITHIGMDEEGISQILCVNDYLFMLPWHGENFYRINLNNYSDNEAFLLDSSFLYLSEESNKYFKYNYYAEDVESIWLSNRFGNKQICISKLDGSFCLFDYIYPDRQATSNYLHKLEMKEFNENSLDLCDYLQYVVDI